MSASPQPPPPEPWQISYDRNVWSAEGASLVRVEGGRLFTRSSVRPDGSERSWLMAKLDGVRVYVTDGEVLITRRDLY